jgi:hypothetical protein
VLSVLLLPLRSGADSKIFAGGYFTTIGGQSRFKFARLSNDTAVVVPTQLTHSAPFVIGVRKKQRRAASFWSQENFSWTKRAELFVRLKMGRLCQSNVRLIYKFADPLEL